MEKKISNNIFIGIILILVAIIGILVALRLHTVRNLQRAYNKEEQLRIDSLNYYKILNNASIALFEEDYDTALKLYDQADSLFTDSAANITSLAKNYIDKKNIVSDSLLQLDNMLKSKMSTFDVVEKALNQSKAELTEKEMAIQDLKTKETELATQLEMEAISKDLMEREKKILEDSISSKTNNYTALTFKNRKGLSVEYFGSMKDGKADGYGIGVYETGGVYKGAWKNNSRHGFGRYKWVNGDVYEGNFVQGIRQGYGVYTFISGEKYEGDWENDLRNGKGVYYSKSGKVILEGTWEKDKLKRTKAAPPVF